LRTILDGIFYVLRTGYQPLGEAGGLSGLIST